MAEVIKTKYMDKATRGYSEYIARDLNALQTISPKEGDRAILLDGSLYICVDNGIWDIAGGAKETDILIITAGYKTGGERGYTIDKTYAEILSAAQAGKTIILFFPKPFLTEYWILSPYRINSDGSGTFRCITPSDLEHEGDAEYILFVTIYPDNTVQAREERFIKELDHRITFKADGQDYQIITVKDGQSVSAPSPNPTSESGTFSGWLNALSGESVTFPLTPTEDLWLNAEFKTVRAEISTDVAGITISTCAGIKSNSGLAVYGYGERVYSGTAQGEYFSMLVSKERDACITTKHNAGPYSFTYNNETWYYTRGQTVSSKSLVTDGEIQGYDLITFNNVPTETDAVKLLDYYFMKDA